MMNVILLVAVVLASACFGSWHDPIAIGVRLYSTVNHPSEPDQSEPVKRFFETVEGQPAAETRDKMRRVYVSTALAMRSGPRPVSHPAKPAESAAVEKVDALVRELEAIQIRTGVTNAMTFCRITRHGKRTDKGALH